jgi:hypothetical protein
VGNVQLTAHQSTVYLNYFAKECRRLAEEMAAAAPAEADRILALYHIPDEGDEPWRWRTRQLRRTLAWYIASQPFGVIAGMIQYGHASAMMFEGYAGTSQSGFRSEIEEERRLAQLSDIVEMYEDWKAGSIQAAPCDRNSSPNLQASETRSEICPARSLMIGAAQKCSRTPPSRFIRVISTTASSMPTTPSA